MATLIKLQGGVDYRHGNIGLRSPSQYIDGFLLAAAVSERIAIPSGATRVVFATTDNIAVKFGDSSVTAAFPSDTTDGTGSELNPTGYLLDNIASTVTHIAVISNAACNVSVSWYKS